MVTSRPRFSQYPSFLATKVKLKVPSGSHGKVSLIGVAARTIAGAEMPNALPVPATPASLRKDRRWSAISQCPIKLLLLSCSCGNDHANRLAQAEISTDYIRR